MSISIQPKYVAIPRAHKVLGDHIKTDSGSTSPRITVDNSHIPAVDVPTPKREAIEATLLSLATSHTQAEQGVRAIELPAGCSIG